MFPRQYNVVAIVHFQQGLQIVQDQLISVIAEKPRIRAICTPRAIPVAACGIHLPELNALAYCKRLRTPKLIRRPPIERGAWRLLF
jgi:hypothetical protein